MPHTVDEIIYDVEELKGLTEKQLTFQILCRHDRHFPNAVQKIAHAEAVVKVNELWKSTAAKLDELGFAELAKEALEQMIE